MQEWRNKIIQSSPICLASLAGAREGGELTSCVSERSASRAPRRVTRAERGRRGHGKCVSGRESEGDVFHTRCFCLPVDVLLARARPGGGYHPPPPQVFRK